MRTRKMVSLSISIVCLLAAIVLSYLALKRLSGSGAPKIDNGPQTSLILPQGRELNFEAVSDFNKTGVIYPYPESMPSEIGVDPNILAP